MVTHPYRVGILGATGLVGQGLTRLLQNHPWFRLVGLAASDRSVGRDYGQATRWRLDGDPPDEAAGMPVRRCAPQDLADCDLVFSSLDSSVAREVEGRFRAAGFAVISNSSAYRQDADVPLVIPEVNAAHLELVAGQAETHEGGFIVTNPNCSTTGLALALAPLHRAFGVRRLVVTTLQAVSGAGVDGPSALEMLGNVLPHIAGEEQKLESELARILGHVAEGRVHEAPLQTSAHCHRVPTIDGHLEAVSVELGERASPERVCEVLRDFRGDIAGLGLPTAPDRPIRVRTEPDRPQPRLDRDCGLGMRVVVGRVRACAALGLKLLLLSHNTMRGAAGGTLLNAELLAARTLLPRRGAA